VGLADRKECSSLLAHKDKKVMTLTENSRWKCEQLSQDFCRSKNRRMALSLLIEPNIPSFGFCNLKPGNSR
jgi:hypothetical protein